MSQQPSENPQTLPDEPQSPADLFFAAASIGMTQWWRWVLGIIAALVAWTVIGAIPVSAASVACASSLTEVSSPWFACVGGKLAPPSLIPHFVLANLSFVIGLIGIWIIAKFLHKKSLTQVTTGRPSFDYSRFLYAALVGLCVLILITLAYRFILGVEMTLQSLNLWVYLPVVLIALVLIPIQASYEEVFFRGYIMQGLSLLTRNKVVLAVVTGVLFTAPHLLNPEPFAFGFAIFVLEIMSFAIFFAVLTLLDGGIELAAGYHSINNIFLVLIANNDVSALGCVDILRLSCVTSVISSEARNLKSENGVCTTNLDSSLRCAAFRMTE